MVYRKPTGRPWDVSRVGEAYSPEVAEKTLRGLMDEYPLEELVLTVDRDEISILDRFPGLAQD